MTTQVTKILQRVLRQDANAPAYVTSVHHRTLVVTEPAPELAAPSVTGTRQRALIQEGSGFVGVGKVHESTLIQVEAPTPVEAASISRVYESALVEDPTVSFINKVDSSALLLIEGPIVLTKSTKTIHSTLTLDLYRGEVLTSKATHAAIGQTEFPTRNPERWKMASILHAQAKSYVDPRSVIAAHQYKAFTMFTGVSVAYPERSVSPARSACVSTSSAITVNGRDLSTYRSYTNVPSVCAATATKLQKPNPINVHSATRGFQIAVETASSKTLKNPISITASYQFHQMSLNIGQRATYQPLQGIHSFIRTLNTNLMAAKSVLYQEPPSSQMNVNGIKVECVSGTSSFLIPTDPSLASKVRTLNMSHDIAYKQTMASPGTIKSTQTTTNLQLQAGVKTAFTDPIGIIPGGRGYQAMLQIMAVSPGYANLPISYTAMQHLEINTVIGKTLRDPATIKDGIFGNQVITEVAIHTIYDDPRLAKPKRRISSASIVGITP